MSTGPLPRLPHGARLIARRGSPERRGGGVVGGAGLNLSGRCGGTGSAGAGMVIVTVTVGLLNAQGTFTVRRSSSSSSSSSGSRSSSNSSSSSSVKVVGAVVVVDLPTDKKKGKTTCNMRWYLTCSHMEDVHRSL